MRDLDLQISQVADTSATVLLRGESGTGKERVARAIHAASRRSSAPFISMSCAAFAAALLESDPFAKGAHGVTLFLEEIGDLDPGAQGTLLQMLQERATTPTPGSNTSQPSVRVIADTHKDLEAAMAAGEFRKDLYYRLNVFTIHVPPLRDRRSDVALLADYFIGRYAAEYGRWIERISPEAVEMLSSYHWPGNVRELENTIIRAVLVCDGPIIHDHHLPTVIQTTRAADPPTRGPLAERVAAYERNLIEDALKTTRGNRAQAALLLQTTERILGYRVRQYAIDCRRYRD